MQNMFKKFLSLLLLFQLLVSAIYARTIIIYHTSDVHGWYKARPARWNKQDPNRLIGGFGALSALVKKESDPVILLDSGDWFQGTPAGIITKGKASVTLMNKMGYTASALGNHEYDFGEPNLKKLSKKAKFAVLAANVKNKKKPHNPSYVKPYVTKDINGIKIAIIGLASPQTKTGTFPPYVEHLKFSNPGKICAKYVEKLKNKVNAFLVLTHNGLCNKCARNTVGPSDVELTASDYRYGSIETAKKIKGADAIIFGGHYHTGLKKGYFDHKSGILFVESGGNLTHASRVELEFDDETNKLISAKSKLIPLWIDETSRDEDILKEVRKIEKKIGKELDKVIAYAYSDMPLYETNLDTSLGNWICDILLQTTKANVAFQNSRGIRASIQKGNITSGDMYKILPFENTIVTLELTGSQIIAVMKGNLKSDTSHIQISGMEVNYTTGSGRKISKIKVFIDGKPIDLKKTYKVTTNSYLTYGGTGGRVFAQGKNIKDTTINMRQTVIEHLKKNPLIKAPPLGRIKKVKSL